MPNTDSLVAVTDAIIAKIESKIVLLGLASVADVTYGDQQKIPRTPFVTVESGPKTRELTGIGGKGRTDNRFTVFILGYISNIRTIQTNRREADLFGEQLELYLHEDVTLGGLIIHGFVTSIEPGYSTRSGELMRVVRLTYQGLTKTLIT